MRMNFHNYKRVGKKIETLKLYKNPQIFLFFLIKFTLIFSTNLGKKICEVHLIDSPLLINFFSYKRVRD